MKGWISIHRCITEHWVWEDEKYLKWWLTIILNVNHESKKFPVGTELLVCQSGQSFRSIEQWTDLFSCSKKTTIRFFEMLKNDNMIQTEIVGKGNRRKHLLTVVNWEKYQQKETENYTERVPKTTPKEYPNVPPNNNDNNDNNENKSLVPKGTCQSSKDRRDNIDYLEIMNFFNKTCVCMPRIATISQKRMSVIKARINEHGKDALFKVIEKASAAPFLNGKQNGKDDSNQWIAGFDWLIKPTNFIKVLEGNYDKKSSEKINPFTKQKMS